MSPATLQVKKETLIGRMVEQLLMAERILLHAQAAKDIKPLDLSALNSHIRALSAASCELDSTVNRQAGDSWGP